MSDIKFDRHADNSKLFRKMEKAANDNELDAIAAHETEDSIEKNECLRQFFAWGMSQYNNAVRNA